MFLRVVRLRFWQGEGSLLLWRGPDDDDDDDDTDDDNDDDDADDDIWIEDGDPSH